MQTIEFCPAIACAANIVRIERAIDMVGHLRTQDALAKSPHVLDQLETISDALILDADDARNRLAEIDPLSTSGAVTQLLCAVRDIRVGDDAERQRAKRLEARALLFFDRAGLFPAGFCAELSQTRFSIPGDQPASRSISASEISKLP